MDSEKIHEKLLERKNSLNAKFKWTEKKILKIKEINQLILDYYHLVYEEMVKIKDSLIELMQSIISKTSECHITAEIWSISTEKNFTDCTDEECEEITEYSWHNMIDVGKGSTFYSLILEDEQSWNEYPFHNEGLMNVIIHYPLYVLCNHSFFPLEDFNKTRLIYRFLVTYTSIQDN